MDQLFAKLTNLGYEVFGVILPGIWASLFLSLTWIALGSLPPRWTYETVPQLTIESARTVINPLLEVMGIWVAIPVLSAIYLLGHILLWIARSGKAGPAGKNVLSMMWLSLKFRIPKPSASYDPKLQRLYDAVQTEFTNSDVALEWREFYPVVKSYLSNTLTYSLVATYQNKYTLHRSIAAAAAAWFWLNALCIVGSIVTVIVTGVNGRVGLLCILLLGALVLVWGFTSSYMYHWQMFGNTIITEAYSVTHAPRKNEPQREKPASN